MHPFPVWWSRWRRQTLVSTFTLPVFPMEVQNKALTMIVQIKIQIFTLNLQTNPIVLNMIWMHVKKMVQAYIVNSITTISFKCKKTKSNYNNRSKSYSNYSYQNIKVECIETVHQYWPKGELLIMMRIWVVAITATLESIGILNKN